MKTVLFWVVVAFVVMFAGCAHHRATTHLIVEADVMPSQNKPNVIGKVEVEIYSYR